MANNHISAVCQQTLHSCSKWRRSLGQTEWVTRVGAVIWRDGKLQTNVERLQTVQHLIYRRKLRQGQFHVPGLELKAGSAKNTLSHISSRRKLCTGGYWVGALLHARATCVFKDRWLQLADKSKSLLRCSLPAVSARPAAGDGIKTTVNAEIRKRWLEILNKWVL